MLCVVYHILAAEVNWRIRGGTARHTIPVQAGINSQRPKGC